MKKKIKKAISKFIATFLSILFVIQILPLNTFAEEYLNGLKPSDSSTDSVAKTDAIENEQHETPIEIIGEETSKREENIKHFLLSDGSYTAVVYPVPVHYSQDGKWTDYDNTLIEVDADESDSKDFTVKSSDYDIRLSQSINNNKFIKIKKDGYEISWCYLDSAKSHGEIAKPIDDGDKTTLENITSMVTYSNVYKNIDFQYIVSSNGVKENIILKSNDVQTSFVAEYKSNGLIPVQIDEKTVDLQNEQGKSIYTISAPYMEDKLGVCSDKITIKILKNDNNSFVLETVIDKEWLLCEDRSFPVVVDPMVKTKPDTATIQNKYITTYNYNLSAYGSMYVGKESNMGLVRSAVKFTFLPTLDRGDMVCGATINLAQLNYSHVNNTSLQINAYEITSAWSGFSSSSPGICSSSDPIHSNTVLDYTITTSSNNYTQISWDITSLVKKWYNGGQNNGVFFASSDSRWAYAQLVSKLNNIQNGKPVLYVSYINNEGLEDYWSYTDQNLGCGTGYVNNYTGNLVLNIPICSTNSASLPAGISYYYNGYQAGRHFSVTQGGGVYAASKSLCGAGWKLNVDEQLSYLTPGVGNNDDLHAQGIKYTYTDSDGTVLYMKQDSSDSNVFHDELGKGYTLTLSGSNWILTDKQNNQKTFTGGGRLLYVQSNQSQDKITYSYNSNGFLTSITDGSGHTISIGRNSNNAIISITSCLGTTQFGYSGSKLTSIVYPDGKTVSFTYDSDYKLTSVVSTDGTSVAYSYPSTGDIAAKNRVSRVTEYSSPNSSGVRTMGNYVSFDYNIGNYTKVTDNKGRSVVYNFDNYGRTVSSVDELGASSVKYTNNVAAGTSTAGKNNKITTASTGTMPVDNLLINHSFERGLESWTTYTANSTGSITSDSTNAYIGSKSIKFNISSQNINTYLSQKYTPTQTGKYTFSFYYKTTGLTGSGIRPMICKIKSDGSLEYASSQYKTASTNGNWERLSVTCDVTSNVAQLDLIVNVPSTSGVVYIDCAQLEFGASANDYNLVENSAFKYGSFGWSNNMSGGDSFNTTHGSIYDSECPSYITNGAFIQGNSSTNKAIYQNIQINMPANRVALQFSGYACAKSVPKQSGRFFALDLCFHYSDNTTEYIVVDFNPSSTTWQYVSQLVMPAESNQNKTVSYVTAYFLYYHNQNWACFSGMNLTLDKTGVVYQYDNNGNIVSAKDMASRQELSTIDNVNRLTGYRDAENANYTYTYNTDNTTTGTTKYQVNSITHTYYAQKFEFQYDSHGNVIQTTQRNTNGTIPIQTNSQYSSNGDRILSAIDSLRNTTTYSYSSTNSNDLRVQSVTQNGKTVNYTYMPNTNIVTGVSSTFTGIDGTQNTVQNTYTYNNQKLVSISHNNFNYSFTYDNFGNRLSTKVGNTTLMSNTFGANNGLLLRSTYGNGATVENIYDTYDRVIGIKYNGTQQFSYVYNANGQVSSFTDNINGKTYSYTYDLLGRLQRTDISDGSSISYTFDNVDNKSNTSYVYNNTTKNTSYTYFLGGVPQTTTYPNGAVKTRSLNAHAQVRPSTLTTPTGNTWSINRLYYTPTIGGTTYTTNVMGSLIYENIGRTLSYTYDASGNISAITDTTGTISTEKTYQYDELNQLIRENDPVANKTTTYTYDVGGNILAKIEYPYTTGSLGTPTNTIVYTYGNTEWKDLLTEYNGNAITYDQIGNPLTYYNGTTFTWNYGRKLATATTADGTSVSYKYNDSGIRTQKTVNGVTTDYFLDGSKIVAQKTGNNTTWYYYDGDGTREAIEYGGNVYYYFYNAQGDVVGLFDNNLNVVVEYTYDSWGNVLSTTGSLASTLGQDNPFRYRGYYFDSETGLYYLNSRYYDANTGRFVNADGVVSTGQGMLSHNMFTYCNNNPVNYIDVNGDMGLLMGIICVTGLVFTLLMIPSSQNQAPAEQQKANEKITYDDVNVYIVGDGEPEEDKINVSINYNLKDYKGHDDYNIHIQDSYKITNRFEQARVIEIIMNSPAYDNNKLTRTQSSYVQEWRAHNAAYVVLFWDRSSTKDADLNNGDIYKYIYEVFIF